MRRPMGGEGVVLMETIINLCGAVTEFANLLLVLGASGCNDPLISHHKHQPIGRNSPSPPSLSYRIDTYIMPPAVLFPKFSSLTFYF
jgi:hypothetical protein